MSYIDESTEALFSRLPELSWKLRSCFTFINPTLLPRGLFRTTLEITPQSCIDDITRDISSLKQEQNERAGHFLATRISQKINVLVKLCQQHKEQQSVQMPSLFTLDRLSSRSQWLKNMQDDIVSLKEQQRSLQKSLQYAQHYGNENVVVLQITAELGEILRCLTLAEETLAHATL
jgi:hypothetical protein